MWIMCVCAYYIYRNYISSQLARRPNEYQGAARPEETILPTYITCINYYQLLITTNPYQSLYQLLVTMKSKIFSVNHYISC